MWNNNSPDMADEKGQVQNIASAVAASPSIAKRQRRPSVRLEELGDQHDRLKMCLPLHDVESPSNSTRENLHMSNDDFKSPYCRPGGHAKNDRYLKGSSPDVEKVCCYVHGLPEPNPSLQKVTNEDQMPQLLATRKGRGGRAPRVPKLSTSTKKVTSVPQSGMSVRAHRKTKVPCMQDAKHMHSGKENNAYSSTGFKASAYRNTSSTSDESGQGGVILLHSQHNNEVRDYLPAHAKAMNGRTNQRSQASSRTQGFEVMGGAGRKLSAQVNGSVCGPRGKLVLTRNGQSQAMQNGPVLEANRGGNIMEHSESHILHIDHRLRPLFGVSEWLQNLGLGRYIELFEVHEVEPEVLPLLTFDDLREMGVFAVGPRRKMFSAIQQFRMAMLPEAN